MEQTTTKKAGRPSQGLSIDLHVWIDQGIQDQIDDVRKKHENNSLSDIVREALRIGLDALR